ncbi:Chaperone protein DnaK [Planctomycetes bacterium Pan216]|uniref:Chaperone protein DnaK n=1 Tax=Kolteria novifilia TaxID=2527975 RepID=A0A518B3C6_9BACT|nr:Chaperone protein DnaK [Planctomycetes bacterium Pan216]
MSLPIVNPNSDNVGHVDAGPPILGIDLGTTFSLAAYRADDEVQMVRDERGDARIPSFLAFDPNGKVTVGFEARRHSLEDPEHTVYSVKRLIGKSLDELEEELKAVPYQVIEREMSDGRRVLHVRIDDREYTPEELSAKVLGTVVQQASQVIGKRVEKAVITVPAYFDESQRQATRDAGRIAGLDVVRIVNEPTAAALAYGLHNQEGGKVAVYDLGGGTFDCSILHLSDGVFRVLSTHGDTHLGGDDIDRAIMAVCMASPHWPTDADLTLRQQLRDACERAKIALSDSEETIIAVEFPDGAGTFRYSFTLDEFVALVDPLIERTLASCRSALRDAELSPDQIDEVVLVGGSSRIPRVRERVEQLFGRPPHCELNPDEVVAMGAAVQASILSGQLTQILLLDINPLSLGIETMGGAVSKLIPRNSTIPAQATERFTTYVDGQTGVEIQVLQGERELAKDCRSLGRFTLSGIPPLPAGVPQIDVTFLIDANGILQVTARENRSGQQTSIAVTPSQGLNRDEVERIIRESIEHAREDFQERRLIELRQKAESNLHHTQKGLDDVGDRLSKEQRTELENIIGELRSIVESAEDVDALSKALDRLEEANQPLVALMMNSVLSHEVVGKKLDET